MMHGFITALTVLPSNLGLGKNQLQRVAAISLVDRVLQDADRLEQVAGNLDLAGEVRRVGNDLLSLGLELHGGRLVIAILHGGLDTGDLTAVVEHLVDIGVQHVGAAVDSGQTSKTLGELTQTVERVDVWRLAISSHGVDVQADAVDSLDHARLGDVVVRGIEGHRVANKVAGVILEAELVINLLHGARSDVQT